MIPAVLRTPRLVLRPIVAADAPALVEHLADWDVAKWLAVVPSPYTPEDAAGFVAAVAPGGRLAAQGHRTWAVAERGAPERLIGTVGLQDELGYWLGRPAWGRGYATEAARAVLDARGEGAGEVMSHYFDGNERSERVLRKLGFVDAGPLVRPCLARGEDVPGRRMRLAPA